MNDLNKTEDYRKEISDWFASGKDFSEGYLLFVRFSHNRALAMQLARKGETMQSKLEYELQKILERGLIIERPVMPIGPVKKSVAPVIEMKAAITDENSKAENIIEKQGRVLVWHDDKIDYDSLNDDQKALFDANRNLYKEMRSWHEKMKLAQSDENRAAIRAQILTLDDTIRDNWKQFDASFQPSEESHSDNALNQSSEESHSDKSIDQMNADPVKAVSNARSYLSKNLSKLDDFKGKPEHKVALIAKIKDRYQVLIDAGQALDETSIVKLKACGIIVE